jgi:hypothetical protein
MIEEKWGGIMNLLAIFPKFRVSFGSAAVFQPEY